MLATLSEIFSASNIAFLQILEYFPFYVSRMVCDKIIDVSSVHISGTWGEVSVLLGSLGMELWIWVSQNFLSHPLLALSPVYLRLSRSYLFLCFLLSLRYFSASQRLFNFSYHPFSYFLPVSHSSFFPSISSFPYFLHCADSPCLPSSSHLIMLPHLILCRHLFSFLLQSLIIYSPLPSHCHFLWSPPPLFSTHFTPSLLPLLFPCHLLCFPLLALPRCYSDAGKPCLGD